VYAECSDPDMPADIKAAATGDGSILLVWRPPLHSNGILTKYTILMKDMSDREVGLTAVLFNICVVLSMASKFNHVQIHISLLGVPSVIHRFVISQSRTIYMEFIEASQWTKNTNYNQ